MSGDNQLKLGHLDDEELDILEMTTGASLQALRRRLGTSDPLMIADAALSRATHKTLSMNSMVHTEIEMRALSGRHRQKQTPHV